MGAIYTALNRLLSTPTQYRPMRSSLTLGAILIYMLNAINYRPAEGRADQELTHTCCWDLSGSRDDESAMDSDGSDMIQLPAMLTHGLYFISGIVLQDGVALRMGGGDTVSVDSLLRLYSVADEQDLKIRFNIRNWHPNPLARNSNRIQNRRKVPVDVRHVVHDEELKAQDRTLEERGVAMMPLPQAAGPDVEGPRVHWMDEDQDAEKEGIDDIIARIWRQFPYDIFENAPNHRSNREGSYLLMTKQDRLEATVAVFKNTDLRRVLSRAVIKVVSQKDWKNLQFRRYFPTKGFLPPTRLQNFPYMLYFQEWNTLMGRLSARDAEVVRESIWKEFKTFQWLPLTDTDRAWNTKRVTGPQWTHLPLDDKKPAVRIALNQMLVQSADAVRITRPIPDEEGSDSDVEVIEID